VLQGGRRKECLTEKFLSSTGIFLCFTCGKRNFSRQLNEEEESMSDTSAKAYWAENIRLIFICLAVWFIVSYGFGILFVHQLNKISIAGYELGFWFAQQGSMYTFVALIFIYAAKMNTLDKKYNVQED
jgi:putative solute:sodium symporter small subunit